jgi:RES domain-containing protein
VPLVAYRVSKAKHPPFDGAGAALIGGRWNSRGRPLIYCARSYAGALLEILVHAQLGWLPGRHRCVVVEVPDDVSVETLDPASLPGWDVEDERVSRAFGDRWLAERRSAALLVPSLVARPFEQNVLINPVHPESVRLRVAEPVRVTWDARLFRSRRHADAG